jgi:hypothetical protein
VIQIHSRAWVALVALYVIAACAGPQPTAPGSSPTPTGAASEPAASPGSTQAGSPAIPAADAAWTSIRWRRLAANDPLAGITTVVRGRDSLLAIGLPTATATGSRSPLWWSADGVIWDPLGPAALGADSIVVGVFALDDVMVALTMVGGDDACQDPTNPCFETRPPLRAWTSVDGGAWSLAAEPMNLHLAPGETSIEPPLGSGGAAGVLIVTEAAAARQIAASGDGRTWGVVSADVLPAGLDAASLTTLRGGYLLTGESNADGLAHALWSIDGRLWQEVPAFGAQTGEASSARVKAVGSGGVVLEGSNGATPGPILWWQSADGQTWQFNEDLAPLGTWRGEGAGSGLLPNGEVVGDGERMVAYDTVSGSKASTSFDGASWTDLTIGGDAPPGAGGPTANLTLTPIGLFWRDPRGGIWFAEPTTD